MTLEKPPTKAELRKKLQSAVDSYIQEGGEIHEIPRGLSGREGNNGLLETPLFDSPKNSRTYVTELIANIESRRRTPARPASKSPASKKPRQKTLYDDFGEPIRKIWVDE